MMGDDSSSAIAAVALLPALRAALSVVGWLRGCYCGASRRVVGCRLVARLRRAFTEALPDATRCEAPQLTDNRQRGAKHRN
jgi:hypothetical protein